MSIHCISSARLLDEYKMRTGRSLQIRLVLTNYLSIHKSSCRSFIKQYCPADNKCSVLCEIEYTLKATANHLVRDSCPLDVSLVIWFKTVNAYELILFFVLIAIGTDSTLVSLQCLLRVDLEMHFPC